MEPNTILIGLGGVGFLIVAYLILDSGGGAPSKRVKSIGVDNNDKKSVFAFMKADGGSRRKLIEASLEEIEKTQKTKKKKTNSLKSKLIQANLKTTPQTFMLISAVLGVLAFGAAFAFKLKLMIALGIGLALGFGLPRWILNFLVNGRQKKFTSHFSDAMDIIVRGVRTGLPLGDCLRIIAHESPEPVRTEFQLLVEAESVGVPLETCIERMYDRMPLSEVNFFGTVLAIQRSTGGNLGESLANLSKVLRERKLLREKIKALSAEAKMSAIIIGALPPVVMILVSISSPSYMAELYTTPTGHRNLMLSGAMMAFGVFVMRKMINFKI
ncbi:MAG: type II secretion system F family protein [Acidimicrobiales bacterium]|nr:type II secretion system F family protein [Hyphomonadaceae bacterium]RZV44351.1 MAG: type II secretion system F family protein [Acidimicrobiales bacterium]